MLSMRGFMNVPAIAQKSFDESRNSPELLTIVIDTLDALKILKTEKERTDYIHQKIDEYNNEAFSHPLVKQLSPCKMGCTACCHTQVSTTNEEAFILAQRVKDGVVINEERLKLQMKTQNSEKEFYKLSYEERKCVFLDEKGACKVYEDRPSVCRTNAVLGSAAQCDSTKQPGLMRLVRTTKSDMVIYAFYLYSKKSGTLGAMMSDHLPLVHS
jgi:Fe-S-cluster containining protein